MTSADVIATPTWVRRDLAGATGSGITVGVIDSGWHSLNSRPCVERGVGFVDPQSEFLPKVSNDDNDMLGHGSACTDILLRVAPGVTVVPIRVFGRKLDTSPEILCAAIRWAAAQRLEIVNISLGTLRRDALRTLYAACETARAAGVILVAAAHATRIWSYPAVFDHVIGVSGGSFATPWLFTFRPDHAAECEAKDQHDSVQWLGHRRNVRGTSFATPCISGIIALFKERNPTMDLDDARHLLRQYAVATGCGR